MPRGSTSGFTKADGRNLPVVNGDTFDYFLKDHLDMEPELRHAKTAKSCRKSYFTKAVGFVEVRREGDICYVQGKVTPEHRVRSPSYSVTCTINEMENRVVEAKCLDCAASEGVCKHVIAFIAWLRWCSDEEAPTSKECYWKKPRLSDIGSKIKVIEVATIRGKAQECAPEGVLNEEDVAQIQPGTSQEKTSRKSKAASSVDTSPMQKENFFNCLVKKLQEGKSNALLLQQVVETTSYSMFHLMVAYKRTAGHHDAIQFIRFCRSVMNMGECDLIYERTKNQGNCAEWHDMRYSRITASLLYAASRCATPEGALVNLVSGASSIPDTAAMKRGRELEPDVLVNIDKRFGGGGPSGLVKKKGIKLDPGIPIFGASPDGILKEKVVEVKCPSTYERFTEYFNKDMTEPAPAYKAQIMLQMLMCRKMKGLFCVAEPSFKVTGHVTSLEVTLDANYLKEIMFHSRKFWIEQIYPRLYNSIS